MNLNGSNIIDISKAKHFNPSYDIPPVGVLNYELKNRNNWYLVDGEWSYFKTSLNIIFLFNELLGGYLVPQFCLNGLTNQIAKRGDKIGLLSPNFRKPNEEYIQPIKLVDSPIMDGHPNLLEAFRSQSIVDSSYEQVLKDLLNFVALDLYMHQWDRDNENYLFKYNVNHELALAHIFDCERSFLHDTRNLRSFLWYWPYDVNYIVQIYELRKDLKHLSKRFEYFHDVSLDFIPNIDLESTITNIEEEHGVEVDKATLDKYLKIDKYKKKLVKEII